MAPEPAELTGASVVEVVAVEGAVVEDDVVGVVAAGSAFVVARFAVVDVVVEPVCSVAVIALTSDEEEDRVECVLAAISTSAAVATTEPLARAAVTARDQRKLRLRPLLGVLTSSPLT